MSSQLIAKMEQPQITHNLECTQPAYFDNFGKIIQMKQPSLSMFKGLVIRNDTEKYLSETLLDICSGKFASVNLLALNNAVIFVLSNGIINLQHIIISVVNSATNLFNTKIQKMADSKLYTNKLLLEMYNDHIKNMIVLKKSLRIVGDYLKMENGKNIIDVYINYLFYFNVINKKYNFGKSNEVYFYELLLNNNNQNDISEFFALFKLYNYYTGFSYSAKTHRNEYFNIELDNMFSMSEKTNSEEFLNTIMGDIDTNIRNVMKNTNADDATKEVTKIVDCIKMCLKICDKTQIMANYLKYLQNRLIDKSCDGEIESEFIKAFNFKDEAELYVKMKYCINDSMLSKYVTQMIHNVKTVEFKSQKYANLNGKKLNKNICDYTLLRRYAWNEGKYGAPLCERMNEPLEVSFHIDILEKLLNSPDGSFSEDFNDRILFVDYDNSTGIIDMELGGKLYKFNATLSQIIILMTINEHGTITAKDLATTLNVSLKNLSTVLNSLLTLKIIIRDDETSSSDPKMTFVINDKWSRTEDKINLITQFEKLKSGKKQIQQPVTNTTNTANIRAQVISYLISKQSASIDDIAQHMKDNDIVLSAHELNDIMERLITTKILNLNGTTYEYPAKESSDTEEETEEQSKESEQPVESNSNKQKEQSEDANDEEEDANDEEEDANDEEEDANDEEQSEDADDEEQSEDADDEEQSEDADDEEQSEDADDVEEDADDVEEDADDVEEDADDVEEDANDEEQSEDAEVESNNEQDNAEDEQDDNVEEIEKSEDEKQAKNNGVIKLGLIKFTLNKFFQEGNATTFDGVVKHLSERNIVVPNNDVTSVLNSLMDTGIIELHGGIYMYEEHDESQKEESEQEESEQEVVVEQTTNDHSKYKSLNLPIKKAISLVVKEQPNGRKYSNKKSKEFVPDYKEKEDFDKRGKQTSDYFNNRKKQWNKA